MTIYLDPEGCVICHRCGYDHRRAGRPPDAGGISTIAVAIVAARKPGYVQYLCRSHTIRWLERRLRERTRRRKALARVRTRTRAPAASAPSAPRRLA